MHKLFWPVLILFGLVIVIGACTPRQAWEEDSAFVDFQSIRDVNDSLVITYLDDMSDGKIGSKVYLGINNCSNKEIWFPGNWGVRIYQKAEDGWVEIADQMISVQSQELILKPSGDEYGSVSSTVVRPDIYNNGDPIVIRIIVIGAVIRHGVVTDEQIAAYVDVTLQP
ncbi:MAG TPA: hypothetical protein PKM21_05650 [Anaerolineales bacterium]|nr:hypothetical protein [Anaerolineales bacterium]